MPEVHFSLRWPDGTVDACYSPSTIVREYFARGASYPLPDLLTRSRAALNAASERVRLRYGSPCSLALGQLARIEARAEHFIDQPDACVIYEP